MAISKILVPVTGSLDSTDVLDMAATVGRLLYAHLEVLHVQPDPVVVLCSAAGYASFWHLEETALMMEQQLGRVRDAGRAVFMSWADRSQIELAHPGVARTSDVTAIWRSCTGMPEYIIGNLGPFSDLIVLARPAHADADGRMGQIQRALFEAERPVLLTPPDPPRQLGRTALVGWNASREALHAITRSLPFLERMQRVILLTIGEAEYANPIRDEELFDYLACHGLTPERVNVTANGQGAGNHLLHEAKARGADLLVMGAYTHSRVRQAILGGATRHVIETADMPVLLAH